MGIRSTYRTSLVLLPAVAAALALAAPAGASQLLTRDASAVSLAVDGSGQALVSFTSGGARRHVLAWGAVNAHPTSRNNAQVHFQLRYGATSLPGGNRCRPYDGPPLDWVVAACDAPDGSYWALQAWQRLQPDYGGLSAPWELHLSHWTGEPATLQVWMDWAYGRYRHLFGRITYDGIGVFGLRATPAGAPLDSYGRNVYLDTRDSPYGSGWRRENSFLTHSPSGTFCYGFYPHGGHPAGVGTEYRATVMGPGVTPDVTWEGPDPGPYDGRLEQARNQLERSLGDPLCTR